MIPSFLLENETIRTRPVAGSNRLSFADKTIKQAASFTSTTLTQWQTARKRGLFQALDARTKVFFLLFSVVLISILKIVFWQVLFSFFVLTLFVTSKVDLFHAYKRILLFGFLFGFLVFIPSCLNIFTMGHKAFSIVQFQHQHTWWIYSLPQEIYVTREGFFSVARLTLKVVNSLSVVTLIASTTLFEHLVKALSSFRIPAIFLLVLTLTYKFVYVLSNTIVETYFAIKLRWWNRKAVKDAEEIVAGRIGYLFRKSWERYELGYQAMLARGFDGKVNFCYAGKFKSADFVFCSIILLFYSILIFFNYSNGTII
jgi:cobalt/nickel transport system permease protein